jgi:outer membrane lipoprotein-sorting protein
MTGNMNDDFAIEKALRDASKAFTPPEGLKEQMLASLAGPQREAELLNARASGRSWLRRCVAAAAILAAVAVVSVVVWSSGSRSAFAQAVDHALASLSSVESCHATNEVANGMQQFSSESWSKRPDKQRIVQSDGRVTISDGARRVTFDPKSLEALQETPVPDAGTLFSQRLSVDGWLNLARSSATKPQGPFEDKADGQPCNRFDLTFSKGSRNEERLHMWFSKADGLLVRCEETEIMPDGKTLSCRQTTTYVYNLPVEDSLFVIPAGLKPVGSPPPDPQLVVSVTGPDDKAVAGATVYYGHNNWFIFDRLSTGLDGRAIIALWNKKTSRVNSPWVKVVEGTETDWLGDFPLGLVVVESADSKSCDMFDMEWLDVFAKHGLQMRNPDAKRVTFRPDKKEFTFGPANRLRYDPVESKLYLSLHLKPKGTVRGKIVSASGNPFDTGKVRIWPVCLLREDHYTGFGKAGNTLAKDPGAGKTMNLLDDPVHWFCAGDGSFSVDVPAGCRFKLIFQTLDVKDTSVICAWPGMTLFPRQGKGGQLEPAAAVAPGEVQDIGEIRLPSKAPPD